MTTPVFDAYAASYDLLYRDKNYAGEAAYVHRLIQQFKMDAKSIVELGSGTGKHACLLGQAGYSVHGVERSPGMLAAAQQTPIPSLTSMVSFSLGDVRTVRLGRTFDVAISLFHVASYQTTNDDLLAYFKTARAHLKSGGMFVFDAWYGPAVLTDRPVVRVKRVENETAALVRIAEPVWLPNENCVEVKYQLLVTNRTTGAIEEVRESHLMRYLFLPEVRLLLDVCGFRLEHAEEWMTGASPGAHSWGVCFVAQAV